MGQKVKGQFWSSSPISEEETSKTGHKTGENGGIKTASASHQPDDADVVHPAVGPREDLCHLPDRWPCLKTGRATRRLSGNRW